MQLEMTNPLFADSKKTAMPYEVFLLVVEALISSIESDQATHTFQIGPCYHHPQHWFFVPDDNHAWNDPNHLAITPCPSNFTSSDQLTPLDQHDIKPMQSRYRETSLPAQINRWSRDKTFQTFHRVHMSLKKSGPDALVLPGIDRFNPAYFCSCSPSESFLLLQPSLRDHALLQHVAHIIVSKTLHLMAFEDGPMKDLSAFPALKQLTFGSDFNLIRIKPLHSGIMPIRESTFDDLAFKLTVLREKYPRVWEQFRKRHIRVFGAWRVDGDVKVEIYPTDTLHMRYIEPNCTCCEREG